MVDRGWPALHVGEVEGVRAVWADVPGPLRAGLVVRVGSADETLSSAGVSHLLEHLALFGTGRPGDHSNGFTDQTVTMYHCSGDADLVRTFLTDVTRQLADPPTHRLADELGVLRAEAAGRGRSAEDTLLTWRYGAAGFGLAAQEQLGLARLDADAVRAWAARYATRGNSVLWFSGPPPAGIAVGLPDGDPVAPPDPRPAVLPRLPAWFRADDASGIALYSVLERAWANGFLEDVLRDRLVDELRVKQAAAYSPGVGYRPVSRGAGRLLALTDIVDGRQTDAVRIFLGILADLGAERPPTEDELAAVRRRREADHADPSAPLGFVTSAAWNLAVGTEPETYESADAGFAGVTPDDVAAAARSALAGAVAMVPQGVRMTREPWVEAPATVHEPVDGRSFEPVPGGPDGELVVGAGGVTRRSGGFHVTAPVGAVVAVQRYADGGRVLVADDGNRVVVEPTLWRHGQFAVEEVDGLFPEHLVVDMGARPADEIPRPRAAQAAAAAEAEAVTTRRKELMLLAVALLVLAVVAAVAVVLAMNGRPVLIGPLLLGALVSVWRARKKVP